MKKVECCRRNVSFWILTYIRNHTRQRAGPPAVYGVVGDFLQSLPLAESLRGAIVIVEWDDNNVHYIFVYYGHCYGDISMLLSQNPNQEQEVQVHDSSNNGPVRDLSQLISIDRMC